MRKSLAVVGCFLLALAMSAQVTFIIETLPPNTPDSDSLFLSGAFNNWEPETRIIRSGRMDPVVSFSP
ncbi:MAG: hypothetical protein H6560_27695 [Lewinellaceae bacterium]|nr:hypothetical protein [Lewinellaceae bacterium]